MTSAAASFGCCCWCRGCGFPAFPKPCIITSGLKARPLLLSPHRLLLLLHASRQLARRIKRQRRTRFARFANGNTAINRTLVLWCHCRRVWKSSPFIHRTRWPFSRAMARFRVRAAHPPVDRFSTLIFIVRDELSPASTCSCLRLCRVTSARSASTCSCQNVAFATNSTGDLCVF